MSGDRAVAVSMIEHDLLMLESQADDYLEDTGLTVLGMPARAIMLNHRR